MDSAVHALESVPLSANQHGAIAKYEIGLFNMRHALDKHECFT